MSYDNRNTYEMKPRKKRSISYYVVWYFICLAVLVVIMLIKGEFSWSRLLASVVFVAVLSVIWYFTEGFMAKQEEAIIKRMEGQLGSSNPYPHYEEEPPQTASSKEEPRDGENA